MCKVPSLIKNLFSNHKRTVHFLPTTPNISLFVFIIITLENKKCLEEIQSKFCDGP